MASADNQEISDWKPRHNPWLIAVVVAMAAFMEVLDTSIANVALPHMAGNLGASQDQSTWVLTSYLVSNAIVLPITGWLTSIMGRKRFFLICIVIFTVSSLLCGIAPSLPFLLFARVLQGAGGGGLQPMAQSILADIFPPESVLWLSPSMQSRRYARPRLDPPWVDGSLTITPGVGYFSSICRWVCSRCSSYITWSTTLRSLSEKLCARASSTILACQLLPLGSQRYRSLWTKDKRTTGSARISSLHWLSSQSFVLRSW